MSSPWSSSADSSSIWNSNSPNLNLLRRYSLRSSSAITNSNNNNNTINSNNLTHSATSNINSSNTYNDNNNSSTTNVTKSTCSWELSADHKYLIGYIVISRQDLDFYHTSLGFQLCGGKPTHDGQYGAIVEHVVPGSLMNLVCKLKVGDEIVEWNGFNLRNKRNDEIRETRDGTQQRVRGLIVKPMENSFVGSVPVSSFSHAIPGAHDDGDGDDDKQDEDIGRWPWPLTHSLTHSLTPWGSTPGQIVMVGLIFVSVHVLMVISDATYNLSPRIGTSKGGF